MPITAELPFGYASEEEFVLKKGAIQILRHLNQEQLEKYIIRLKNTIKIYNEYKQIFEIKSKGFLKKSISYYYRAIEDLEGFRLEEALIDLMISLESLLSTGVSYRLLLRSALLLNIVFNEKMQTIYQKIRKMYKKRNEIVHGSVEVDLSYDQLWDFRKYVRIAILIILYMNINRNKIIELLDNTIINEIDSKKEIIKNIYAAREKMIKIVV